MPFVVDASIAICWLLPDEYHPTAEVAYKRFPHDIALAPALWWYEVRNVLMTNERRGRLDHAKTRQALQHLEGLPIDIDMDVEENDLLQISRRHRLTVYDAAYLELALRKGYPLATLDTTLAAAAQAEQAALIR